MDARRSAPSTARNRDPIAAVLRGVLPPSGIVLEIASGAGEHAVHFARAFPALDWQPSDPDHSALASIAAWREVSGQTNLRAPVRIDAMAADWPVGSADAVLCINMAHISPWEATVGLVAQSVRLLPPGGPLILYGPYLREGVETAPGNLAFDADLKRRNAEWGIRRLEDVVALAESRGLVMDAVHEMPANNLTVIFRRKL